MMTRIAIALLGLVLCTATSNAVVTFDWSIIRDPGNLPDQLYPSPAHRRFGGVNYVFRISKYEVTNDQYVEFLNAVDPLGSNPDDIFDTNMEFNPRGGITYKAIAITGSKYSSKPNMGNKPVNFVSFFDSMRFVNWLENGQPTGGSGTESGAYTIGTGLTETRDPGATFFIPSEDEWYKAAYYDPRNAADGGPPGDDNYWFYPTMSDTAPAVATADASGNINNPSTNVANHSDGASWNGQVGNVTTVGTAGAESTSFYGTFDQGGNVWEWNESIIYSQFRGLRGGHWDNTAFYLRASIPDWVSPAYQSVAGGFRVASIPVPTGDLNGDGQINCADVDSLVAEIAGGSNRRSYDLTGDGLVNIADLNEWRVQGGAANLPSGNAYLAGDANLDGSVDGSDFSIWNTNKFTNVAAWCSGDFTADGSIDGSDFSIWNNNRFISSASATAVPEPGTTLLSLIACLAWLPRRIRDGANCWRLRGLITGPAWGGDRPGGTVLGTTDF